MGQNCAGTAKSAQTQRYHSIIDFTDSGGDRNPIRGFAGSCNRCNHQGLPEGYQRYFRQC